MPKPFLFQPDAQLESDAITTMLAGLKLWRPDLTYPESHSDMQGCFRALLCCYELKRRPIPQGLRIQCDHCDGNKKFVWFEHEGVYGPHGMKHTRSCPECDGKGYKLMEC